MPAKKAASKKRKKTASSRKKVAKKATRKAASKKKSATRKKASSRKKTATRKPSKKKTAKKKVAKKAAKKVAKKKASSKKTPSKKSTPKKSSSKKKVAKKAPSRKKTISKKKPARKAPARKTPARKAPARKATSGGARKDLLSGPIHGIEPYQPKRGEEYMSAEQLEHFEAILSAWKHELMNEVDRTVHHMQDEAANFPDPSDRATQESEFGLELRTRDRERKLLRKINSALARIEDGSYGFCEETGEEIGLKRLEARPVATLCLEAQERREMAERQYRDRDDRYR